MAIELLITIDKKRETALSRQVYGQILQAIAGGCLKSGDRLPATRLLSKQLLVSRSVVLEAYEQLQAEGYLEMRKGAGTFVAATAAEAGTSSPPVSGDGCTVATKAPEFISFDPLSSAAAYDFRHGVPAWDVFPMDRWQRALNEACRRATPDMLTYGPAEGSFALRDEIARLVRSTRSIPALPEQIVITTGATQALDILSRLCLSKGDQVLVEDPTHHVLREIFSFSGGEIIPVPVDQEGICVRDIDRCLAAYSQGPERTPKLLYVTPSHQFPIGVTLSFNRRIQLLEWARRSNALIIEDDYDSEYRYVGQKASALAGLDTSGRVVYVGSFSKILFPALRIGYAILPPALVEPFLAVKMITDRMTAAIEQEALADFIRSGQYARHIGRMGKLYATRRACLVEALQREFGDRVHILGDEAGLHLLIELQTAADELALAAEALRYGARIYPASGYYIGSRPEYPTFILGYANLSEHQIRLGIGAVARAEQALSRN
ncbi:PLP-dependent aminotransferase family protein [Paenibacillus tepidiphilus]|uniref:MocR-like pyridoxine biosynthesis transcription factor PdxR n=1 Tax=Paenibacillus tepidiphilus TaxID=2608683 RepID=UPI00123A1C96|nr:PLP-dependent aminotransferase family protein [Paenibacillus tepidiphilus]